MFSKSRPLLLLHFIVLIWGFSPILGKLINLQGIIAYQLVWFRMVITVATVAIYLLIVKQSIRLPFNDVLKLCGVGAIIAFHWFCFYNAINVSNVSVTLVAFATGTLFTSIIEPVFYKRRFIRYEIAFGMVIIGAIAMIFKVETQYTLGIIFGMLAAFTSSLFTVFNGLLVRRIPSSVIAMYELSGGVIALTIYLLLAGEFRAQFFELSAEGLGWLAVLSVLGTAFPFIASVNLMKKISPYTVTLTVNLETVYGIIIAVLLWKQDEAMTPGFYLGTLIILATIFGNGLLKGYLKKQMEKAR
ncbi:MAG: permease [Bacteroidota bacterium]|jgi:drug/metabolite transporter (DMT)-like permease|nr:permease [Bacteroidota bacterium]